MAVLLEAAGHHVARSHTGCCREYADLNIAVAEQHVGFVSFPVLALILAACLNILQGVYAAKRII